MYLFFDTETTGLPDYKLELNDERQPHVVQLGMILTDENFNEISALKTPIIPDGFEIDENGRAFEVHGITNRVAQNYGMPMKYALNLFKSYEVRAKVKIAHNYRFDGFLLKCAHVRHNVEQTTPPIDRYCTMKGMAEVINNPLTEKAIAAGLEGKPSNKKLVTAYKYFTGKDLDNAHDAFADTRACLEVFRNLKELEYYKYQGRYAEKQEDAA